eukprot:g571.t1
MPIAITRSGDNPIHLKIAFKDGSTIQLQMDKKLKTASLRGLPEGAVSLTWGLSTDERRSETIVFEKPIMRDDVTEVELAEKSFMRVAISPRKSKVWSAKKLTDGHSVVDDRSSTPEQVDQIKRAFARLVQAIKKKDASAVIAELSRLDAMKRAPSTEILRTTKLGKLLARLAMALIDKKYSQDIKYSSMASAKTDDDSDSVQSLANSDSLAIAVVDDDDENPNASLSNVATATTVAPSATWQWEDGATGSGSWRDYGPNEQNTLEQAFARGDDEVSLFIKSIQKTYTVKGISGPRTTQRNPHTGAIRAMRRHVNAVAAVSITVAPPVAITDVATVSAPPPPSTASVNTNDMSRASLCGECNNLCCSWEGYDFACVTDDDKDCLKESCNCLDRDRERELPCGGGLLGYLVLLPFLPLALVWLAMKWIVCQCGPVILCAVSVKVAAHALCNVLIFICGKTFELGIVVFDILSVPVMCLYEYVLYPIYVTLSDCVVAMCRAICSCCRWIHENMLIPFYNAVTGCCTWIYMQVLVPFCNACNAVVTYVYNAVTGCCTWIYTQVLVPFCNACNAVVTYVYNAVIGCCTWIYTQVLVPFCNACNAVVSYVYNAVTGCCTWIYTQVLVPFCNACNAVVSYLCAFIMGVFDLVGSCLSAIYTGAIAPCLNAVGSCLAAVGGAIYSVLAAVGGVIYNVLAAVGGAIYNVLAAVGGALYAVIAAIGGAIGAVLDMCPF